MLETEVELKPWHGIGVMGAKLERRMWVCLVVSIVFEYHAVM